MFSYCNRSNIYVLFLIWQFDFFFYKKTILSLLFSFLSIIFFYCFHVFNIFQLYNNWILIFHFFFSDAAVNMIVAICNLSRFFLFLSLSYVRRMLRFCAFLYKKSISFFLSLSLCSLLFLFSRGKFGHADFDHHK